MSRSSTPALPQAEGEALRWELRRNCSMSPRQTAMAFLALCSLNVPLGLGFLLLGYPMVTLFSGIELSAVSAALLVYARHACDRETLTLEQGQLTIDQHCGSRLQRTALPAAWVRVVPPSRPGELLTLSAEGRELQLGRHLLPQHRPLLARELRRALARHPFLSPPAPDLGSRAAPASPGP